MDASISIVPGRDTRNRSATAPTFIDLFSGCGGLSLGLLQTGWRGLCAVEKDSFAFETLRANLIEGRHCPQFEWPQALPIEPLRLSQFLRLLAVPVVARQLVGKVDLIAGGPPCQGFSFAGKRRHDDPRNRLFKEYIKVVTLLRPRLLLIENVPGLAVKHNGRRLSYSERISRALRKVGYECYSDIHRAVDFGVPQWRPRYFLIGVDSRVRGHCDAPWLKSRVPGLVEAARTGILRKKGLEHDVPVTVRDAIDDLRISRRGARLEPAEVPRRLQVRYVPPKKRTAYGDALRAGPGTQMDSMRLARHTTEVTAYFAKLIRYCEKKGRRGVSLASDERGVPANKKFNTVVLNPNRPSHTLTSLPDDLIHYSEPRILTVREYARLQSFPDWFLFRGKYTTGGDLRVRECPRYTQVANAVAPFVAEAFGVVLRSLLEEGRSTRIPTCQQDAG